MSDETVEVASKEPPVDRGTPGETTWGTSKRAFVTTLIAITLNPVSAGVGYFMNHYLQRPSLEIRYINSTVEVENAVFPKDVWDLMQKDQESITQIREGLTKLLPNPSESPCLDWLDEPDSWRDECMSPVNRWLRGYKKAIRVNAALS